MSSDNRLALPLGTVLNQYRIDAILGHGGFGIVYKATHTDLEYHVAIKEYLPQELATREANTVHPISSQDKANFEEGLDRFLQEAKKLVQFESHANIVRCRDFFRVNGTAYLVMDFEDGLPLSELLKQHEQKNKKLSEQQILDIILPLLDGLKTIHEAGVLHRDIKPGNIFIRRSDSRPVLIDFGAAKQNYSQHSKSMAPYSPGYAAAEQIEEEGNLGPWTDIYAIGAVLWRIVSGQNPPQVEKRLRAAVSGKPDSMAAIDASGYSKQLVTAIQKCLGLEEEDRYQSAAEVITALTGKDQPETIGTRLKPSTTTTAATVNTTSTPLEKQSTQQQANHKLLPIAAISAVFILALGSWWWFSPLGSDDVPSTTSQTQQTPAEKQSPQEQARQEEAQQRNDLAGEMVTIPAGSFRMGDLTGNGRSYEKPVHNVTVKSFRLGKTEVTFAQWDACVAGGGCSHKPGDEGWGRSNRPVVNVNYDDITQQFIPWLNSKTGLRFRLPSEAEWEYAARAGTQTDYPWGNAIGRNNANCDGCGSQWDDSKTAPVGLFASNAFGLHDMHGNVWEWTQDCWNDNYTGAPSDGRAWAAGDCDRRVLRGGAWFNYPAYLRSSFRYSNTRGSRYFDFGFRLAQDL